MFPLLKAALACKAERDKITKQRVTLREKREYIQKCIIQFHGYNGLSVEGFRLCKNMKEIVDVDVLLDGRYQVRILHESGMTVTTSFHKKDFEDALVEGVSHFI